MTMFVATKPLTVNPSTSVELDVTHRPGGAAGPSATTLRPSRKTSGPAVFVSPVNAVCEPPSIVVPFAVRVGSGVSGAMANHWPLKPASLSGIRKSILPPARVFAAAIAALNDPGPLSAVFVTRIGGRTGVTLLDAAEAAPAPTPLVAVTVNVYAVPFVSPVTVIGLAAPVATTPPGDEVTV